MSGPTRLSVVTPSAEYEVRVGDGLLSSAGALVREVSAARRCALVTDENVHTRYGPMARDSLRDAGFEVAEIVLAPGERSKSWTSAGEVLERMAAARLDRTDVVVALGGGVVGDLGGFAAAVYLRGIDYVQVPTTLLAQVDSSVGGKTGVDLQAGKNLAGAFKQPLLVLADTETLDSLPAEEWQSGLAEVAKAAMLKGLDRLDWMTRNASAIKGRDRAVVREAVVGAIEHKIGVVSADEREAGLRESLNYGHTLGHAIERVAGYGAIPHGVAVAEGMRFAARLSERMLGADPAMSTAQGALLDALGIGRPEYPGDVTALVDAMHSDKKARGGTVRFALLAAPGDCRTVPVEDEVIAEELRLWIDGTHGRG